MTTITIDDDDEENEEENSDHDEEKEGEEPGFLTVFFYDYERSQGQRISDSDLSKASLI